MEQITKRFMNWASILEDSTREQVQMTSEMPFVYPHLALMPDAHLGKGCAVGAVVPTLGAIMPAVVGVDIGCFTGDTEVELCDGTSVPLRDLERRSGNFAVWSYDQQNEIIPAYATAKKTRKMAALVEVVIDNGETIRCTPDHEFLLRSGEYARADSLAPGTSLMPFYKSVNYYGYPQIRQPKSQVRVPLHQLVGASGLIGEKPAGSQMASVHHADGNVDNNDPSNLEWLTQSEHLKKHHVEWAQDPEKAKARAETAGNNWRRYMEENPDHAAGNGERGKEYLVAYNVSEVGRAKSKETASRLLGCPFCDEKVKSYIGMSSHLRFKHGHKGAYKHLLENNHKVLEVREIGAREDVYCLTVPGPANFALAAGVFVHNCGMQAVLTQYTANDLHKSRKPLREAIEKAVPLSAGNYNTEIRDDRTRDRIRYLSVLAANAKFDPRDYAGNWELQLGTLGSGNHFIEVCLDEQNRVWLFLHSGSRGVGNKIAMHHIKVAQKQCAKRWIDLPSSDLAYLVEGDPEFWKYIRELRWAQEFARVNREEMMDRVVDCFSEWIDGEVTRVDEINCHHNYTTQEKHFGKDVWLSRKGAIDAHEGVSGLIPGSMGTASYIVEGLGNRLSLNSSPHGAGREYGRNAARQRFTVEELETSMKGIEWSGSAEFIDEIPGAYKDIDVVMEDAKDLVKIRHTLHQIVNVKGD